ncbi:MAG: ABC transporter ATP-binding protein, partial [Oscillospiraceae bacterium]|nr:ABC transporter ATP-binding protein [Oscillospiraceae bacterium]
MKQFLQKLKSETLREMLEEYRWLIRCSWQYKRQILWYLMMGVLGTVMSLAGSILSKYIIDAVTGYDSHSIIIALIFFVLMQLSQIIIRAVSSRISTKISIEVNQKITAQVYNTLLKTDWESLSAYHSGDLLTRVGGDVSTVSASVLGWIPDLFTRLLQFIGTFCVILYFDKTLAFLALLTAPVTLLMSRYVMRMMRHHNKKMRQLSSDMTVFNTESFQNIQIIKAFDRTNTYTQKHQQILSQYREASLDYNRFSIRKNTVMSLVGTVVALVCFAWSVYRLWSGHITYGTVTLFLQLSGSLGATFSALAGMIPSAINAATAAGRIIAITQLPQEDPGDPLETKHWFTQAAADGFSIQAQDLSYCYEDGTQVLSHVEFSAESGQIIALTGPSGEGKTTLLRLFLGIVQPKGGTLQLVGNADTIPVGPATRCLFSYVPQGNTLFSGTIEENLKLIRPDATDEMLQKALDMACATEFVSQLPMGLQTPVKERGGGMSEGQLQRLC